MREIEKYTEHELYEITQMARLRFLGEEVAKQYMTEDEWIIATMACLKYIGLELNINHNGVFVFNGKQGFVSKEGVVLPLYYNTWYFRLREGFIEVKRKDGEWNHVNMKGEILSKEWWYFAKPFCGGFARVQRVAGKEGFIDTKGIWYDELPN
jgi:hypothetical protein